jgi:hypothetical protein
VFMTLEHGKKNGVLLRHLDKRAKEIKGEIQLSRLPLRT